ncbi:hypothetical protein [uncultured Clostridium sp.]|uniref:hypothetical protein n=1 Tax=uncultured Clostridium sp. TaxID=59620 RepID=UPI0026398DF6|nr:hypothetical protein [uncultured Clostridium sp.]
MTTTIERQNVAPSSVEGHFIKGAKKVVNLDKINETFLVEATETTILETKNHTSLEIKEDCLITCQVVYNPFEKMYSKSKD